MANLTDHQFFLITIVRQPISTLGCLESKPIPISKIKAQMRCDTIVWEKRFALFHQMFLQENHSANVCLLRV